MLQRGFMNPYQNSNLNPIQSDISNVNDNFSSARSAVPPLPDQDTTQRINNAALFIFIKPQMVDTGNLDQLDRRNRGGFDEREEDFNELLQAIGVVTRDNIR